MWLWKLGSRCSLLSLDCFLALALDLKDNLVKKIVIGISLFAFSLVSVGLISQRHALACELSYFLNFRDANGQFFIGSDIPLERIEELSQIVSLAHNRITRSYGAPKSTPKILFTSDPSITEALGANETATMHRTPWRSCIVIGPKGQNIDVMAHEWLHAEIQERVGLWRFIQEIPIWFDEGVALTVDLREPFLPENIELSEDQIGQVRSLVSGKAFFSGNLMENYQAARLTVKTLIDVDSFYRDLERISNGYSFDSVFLKANTSIQPNADETAD